jgi:hypothetical protein
MTARSKFPALENLEVAALARIFADTTNSYKLLFFKSLLQAFADSNFEKRAFYLDDLAIDMLVNDSSYHGFGGSSVCTF